MSNPRRESPSKTIIPWNSEGRHARTQTQRSEAWDTTASGLRVGLGRCLLCGIECERSGAGAEDSGCAAPLQNKVKSVSDYVPADTKIAIHYRTKRDPKTGVVSNAMGEVTAKTLNVNCDKKPSSAAQPYEVLLVGFVVLCNKAKGKYAITPVNAPVKLENKKYTIKLEAFAQKFATNINCMLPGSFDPNATDFDFTNAVTVIITPVWNFKEVFAMPAKPGVPVTLSQKLMIAFDLPIGDSQPPDDGAQEKGLLRRICGWTKRRWASFPLGFRRDSTRLKVHICRT